MKSKYYRFYQSASMVLLVGIILVFFLLAGILSADELSENISEIHKYDQSGLVCAISLIVLTVIFVSLKHIICFILSVITASGVRRSLFGRRRLDVGTARFKHLEAIYVDNDCSYFKMVRSFYLSSLRQLSAEIDRYQPWI